MTATDLSGNQARAQSTLYLIDEADGQPPQVELTSPGEGDELIEAVEVRGSILDPQLSHWELEIAPASPNASYELVAEGTAEIDGDLIALLDPTRFQGGEYRLRLSARDAGGLASTTERIVSISAEDNKSGLFQITYTDAVLAIPGFPVTLQRTYRSGDRARRGAFGYGWDLSLRSMKLQINNVPGEDWYAENIGSFLPNFVLRSNISHEIKITDAEGNTIIFEFAPYLNDSVSTALRTAEPELRERHGHVLRDVAAVDQHHGLLAAVRGHGLRPHLPRRQRR